MTTSTVSRRLTFPERYGWVLVAALCTLMTVFGAMAFFLTPDPAAPIDGSLCCTGQQLSTADPWVFEYVHEIARYMATFMFGMGLFGLLLATVPLRRGEQWAWVVLWYVPVLFAVHGFVLGSFPFDIPPLVLTTLGLLLSARTVFGRPQRDSMPSGATAIPEVSQTQVGSGPPSSGWM